MRFETPITVAVVVLTVRVAPITAQPTTEGTSDDSMTDTSEMAEESMADTTDATESGSSAFAPGFGVGAALVALVTALYVARRRP